MKYLFLLCTVILSTSYGVIGQSILDSLISMDSVVVFSYRHIYPGVYTLMTPTTIDKFQANAQNMLNKNPSIWVTNGENYAQDLRISIRGFGARSAFGIRGVRMYMDGIPFTTADGTSQIDELSHFDIDKIRVINMGQSAYFGNAGGGTLWMESPQLTSDLWRIQSRYNVLGANDIGISKQLWKPYYKAYYSLNRHVFKGKRAHSESQTTSAYTRHLIHWNKSINTTVIASAYNSPQGDDPGALTQEEIMADRYQANTRNLTFDAGEKVSGWLLGQQSKYFYNYNLFSISSWLRDRNFVGLTPTSRGGYIDLQRKVYGSQASWQNTSIRNIEISVMYNIEGQNDHRKTYINNNGAQGELVINRNERVINHGLSAQLTYSRNRWEHLLVGRQDFMQQWILDKRNIRPFTYSIISTYKMRKANVFASVGTSYESPTLNELSADPSGQNKINTDLNPEQSLHVNVGIDQWQWTDKINSSINFYFIKIQNQIVPYEINTAPGMTFYRNSGGTHRSGVDVSVRYLLSDHHRWYITYAYMDYTYHQYLINNNIYNGNQQPLIPRHKWTLSGQHQWIKNWSTQYQCLYVGAMSLDDGANVFSDSAFDIQLSLNYNWGKTNKYNFGVLVHNALDTWKYSNYRVNAAANRYYEVASPRNISLYFTAQI
jgi:iron complex outermembrane recepter protein